MGFIYKIEVEGELYIGSTKLKLCQRQYQHNHEFNNSNRKDYNNHLYKFCREKKVKKIICELIEEVDDTELVILEQEYIKMLEPTLNSNRAYRTEEEQKEYNNKKSKCPICDKLMIKNNVKKHIRRIH